MLYKYSITSELALLNYDLSRCADLFGKFWKSTPFFNLFNQQPKSCSNEFLSADL